LTVATGAGRNTLLVSDIGSSAAGLSFGLTNKQITATDLPVPIAYTSGAGTLNVELDGSNLVATIFNVASTLPATNSVTLNGGAADGNAFNIGSTAAANNGKLGGIGSAITVNGGPGTGNTLEVNDHGTTGAYNYSVSDTSVNYGPGSPIPPTFGGVNYSAIQSLQLDTTEQPNAITVAPSLTTVMQINAYGQLGGADSLQINTANVSGPVTNNPSGGPVSFNGFFSFVDGHENVNYTNIESFPTPAQLVSFPIIAYAADAGLSSQPLIKVFNAQTGQQVLPSNPFDPGNPQRGFLAYEASYHGGVRIAVGYFDTSGQPEIAVAPGAGHTPIVEVFTAYGQLLYSFNPGYAASVTGALNIAAGNVFPAGGATGEIDDLVTVPSRGVSEVKVFYNQFHTNPAAAAPFVSNDSVHNRDFTVWTSTFIGGSTVAVADVNSDGRGDIIVGSGSGMVGTINTYDVTLNKKTYTPLKSFTPFGAAYRGGVNISAVTPTAGSDITAPMIAASQQQGTGQVKILNGSTGAVQFTTTVAANSAVRTASRIVNGRYFVFVTVPSSGLPTGMSKIVEVDPVAASAVDFIFDSDPTFAKLFVG
jgi:hypothetical protein